MAHPLASRQRLNGYDRGEKTRRPEKKKKDGRVINTKSQAVAATAVGVSWLTAGIATGGLVIAGTLVAAGVTVGSMGGELHGRLAEQSKSEAEQSISEKGISEQRVREEHIGAYRGR